MTSALAAVTADIAALPESLRSSGLAATALILAERLDEAATRDTAPISRELRNTLEQLRDLAKDAPKEADDFDRLLAKRPALRIAGA